MAFLQGLMGGSQVLGQQAEQELRQKETVFKSKKLDQDMAQLEFQQRQHRDKVAKDGFEQAVKTMEQLAQTAANMPAIKPGSALDQVIDTQKQIVAKYAELTQQDPTIAEVMAQNVRAGVGQAIKPMQVGMGGKVINPQTGEVMFNNPVQAAPQGPSEPERFAEGMRRLGITVSPEEIKRKYGMAAPERAPTELQTKLQVAREMNASDEQIFTMLGMNPKQQDAFSQKLAKLRAEGIEPTTEQIMQMAGAGPKVGTTVEIPGEFGTTRVQIGGAQGATAPGTSGDGQGGKPLPREAQDNLTGAFSTLNALGSIEKNLDKTGVIKGWMSMAGAKLGTDEGAVAFDIAQKNMRVQAQSLIKGIPSNFDVQTFIATLPQLTDAEPVAKKKVEFTKNVASQLVKDTISYYKYTGFRIPPAVVEQAKGLGIDLESVKPWSGAGSVTANAERLLQSGPKIKTQDNMAEPDFTQEDLEFTAKKHGITVDEVKRRLGVK